MPQPTPSLGGSVEVLIRTQRGGDVSAEGPAFTMWRVGLGLRRVSRGVVQ